MEFFAQIIGGIAVAFWVVSIQNKDRKNILFFQTIANFLYLVEYFMLGAFSAGLMNLVSLIRCFVFSRKGDEDITFKYIAFFSTLVVFFGMFSFKGLISLIPIIITLFYTVSSWSAKWNRITVLIAAFIWIYYNLSVKAYISILGNVFEIISGIFAIIKFRKK